MSDGTTLNGIEARRIHRRNAQDIKEHSETMLGYYRDRLLIMAAMSPMTIDSGDGPETWDAFVRREVSEVLDEMREEWWQEFCSTYILDYPDEVRDDYDQPQQEDTP